MTKLKKISVIIVGVGDNGLIIKNILEHGGIKVAGFLDDNAKGEHILGKVKDFIKFHKQGCHFFISIADNKIRKKLFLKLKARGVHFINAIHRSACVETEVEFGVNIMVGALTYINRDSAIGDDSFINNSCNIEHHNQINEHCNLGPGVVTGGWVKIGEGAFLGLRSVIRNLIAIGENTIVGMGSVVVKNLPSKVIAFGNPAKITKKLK